MDTLILFRDCLWVLAVEVSTWCFVWVVIFEKIPPLTPRELLKKWLLGNWSQDDYYGHKE